MTTFQYLIRTTLAVVATVVLVAGCAPERGGDVYRRGETLRAQSVELGVVEGVRVVQIEGSTQASGVGTVGGAVLGGLAGSTLGGGSRANAAGAIAGAIAGGLAGTAIERDMTRSQGLEITVRLDSGRLIAIVQDGGETFRVGERVRILSDGRTTRVTR